MNWKKEIDELEKEKLSEKMGGAEKLKKQKKIIVLILGRELKNFWTIKVL